MKSCGLLLKLNIKSLSVFSWLMYSIVSWICSEHNRYSFAFYYHYTKRGTGIWSAGRPYLHLQCSDLLLVGRGGQEAVHLAFQWVIHLHIDVVARRLLLIGGVHTAQRRHKDSNRLKLDCKSGRKRLPKSLRWKYSMNALQLKKERLWLYLRNRHLTHVQTEREE